MKTIFPFILCCAGLVVLFVVFGIFSGSPNPYSQALPAALHIPLPQTQKSQPATLLFVGDIMLDRGVEWEIQKNGGDWRWPFLLVADVLRETDLVFGNLESQISDKGKNVGSIYSFRADPQTIQGLTYAGFDVLSVANNHSFDYTREAFEDSMIRLQEVDIAPVADTLVLEEITDTTIGFLAYSNFPGPGSATWENLEKIGKDISQAKSQIDILVVSLHAGEEYQTEPNAFQKAFAKVAIDHGADLIVGHHAHVFQELSQYKEKWIAYGLGNFVFDQDFSEETMQGAILKVVVENKKIQEVSLLPVRLTSSFQVFLEQ